MRNAEVIRQWKILKTIEAGRFTSSAKLADDHGVTERTIRRDIEALQEAGCFSVLLEGVPAELAARVTEVLSIPTIGIVHFPDCGCAGYSFFSYSWPTCGSGLVEPHLSASIPGPATIYYPAYVGASPMDFGFTVNVTEYVPPAADFSVTAPGSWTDGNTCGAVNDCNLRASEDQIWAITIPTDGPWIFSLCNSPSPWDTYIYLGTTACTGDIGSNDDGCAPLSTITANVTAGVYYLTVEGWSSTGCGSYTLDVYEAPPAPPNDNCGGTSRACLTGAVTTAATLPSAT